MRQALSALALVIGLAVVPPARSAFVYESATEFFTAGSFLGDGSTNVLVLDKLTGNARVGLVDNNGNLAWSAPLVTGSDNLTGCAVGRTVSTNRDSLAVTAPELNHVYLLDLSNTNSTGAPVVIAPNGIGPHSLADLAAPEGGTPAFDSLLVASSFNSASTEQLDLLNLSNGVPAAAGSFFDDGSFERANALQPAPDGPTFAVGVVRGQTNDELHIWQFTNSPAVMLVFSNLSSGSAYVFGNFNAEPLPRFIFYQPGGTNLIIVPLLQTNAGYAFGAPVNVSLSEAVQQVFFLALGTNGSALLQYADGVQGLQLPGGAPVLSSEYQTGTGAAGNVFIGLVPLPGGQFVLLDAPPGSAASAHAQVIAFDGTNFAQRSTSNLPLVSSRGTRANVWLFQLEPFVYRSPGFIASLNSPDWADGVSGLPGAVQVLTEADSGTNSGLGNVTTNNLGAPPGGTGFGIANQYNPAISLFSYSPPRAPDPITVTISPPPGSYGSPLGISFTVSPPGAGILYRAGDGDSWHLYSASFSITNDTTIQYYGTNAAAGRSQLQLAGYSLGSPSAGPLAAPLNTNPGNTNLPPVIGTNEVILSANGTVFYGRRSTGNVGTIWAINLDGSGDTYITTGVRPRVSPDGRWLAFLREGNPFGNQGNLWIRDLQAGVETRLFTNPDYITGYEWETNAAALLMDYACGIWDLNTNGTLTAVISGDCYDDAPARSPVDGRIAFQNLDPVGGVAGLYVADANGNAPQAIVSTVPGASWPAWSPDGSDLVFADSNNTNANSGQNLWVVAPDGSDLVQITGFSDTTNGFPHGALWSPDGTALVGAGTIFGTNGLWIIPLTPDRNECSGPPVLLPTTPGDAIDFAGSIVVAPAATVSTPGLFIRMEPNAAVVYWSTNYQGFGLESTTNLGPGAAWTAVSGPYFMNGGDYEYHEAKNVLLTTKFFRLIYPTVIYLTPSQPQLALSFQTQTGPNQTVLTWPVDYAGYTLESTTNLAPPAIWSPVANSTGTITNGYYEFRQNLDPQTPGRFFRLRWP